MPVRAFIIGCAGLSLEPRERDLVGESEPWGLILFARNCNDPVQVKALAESFRAAVGRPDAPVLVDQEGGRVQRLRPPHWPALPPAAHYGRIHGLDPEAGCAAARLGARVIGRSLREVGITVDCAPVCDLSLPATHSVIGDRSFASEPERVAELANAWAAGLMQEGVLPVMKHIPGHGRATVDSHAELPVVDAGWEALERDFRPFAELASLPMAMSAHVVYRTIDADLPATLSATVLSQIVRDRIGFQGLLLSDDISMGALAGPVAERATRAWDAGIDVVLHCNGDFSEMRALAAAAPALAGRSGERAEAALAILRDEARGREGTVA